MIGLSALLDWVFRENLPDPLERLLRCGSRGHSLSDDVGGGEAPDLLRLDLRITGVVHGILRYCRAKQPLPGVSRYVLVLRIEPERIILGDFRHRREPSSQATFQIGIRHLGLDDVFRKILGYFDILRPLRDEAAADGEL